MNEPLTEWPAPEPSYFDADALIECFMCDVFDALEANGYSKREVVDLILDLLEDRE